MKYFKVKKDSHDIPFGKSLKLVAHELLTLTELKTHGVSSAYISKHMDKVNVNKNKTYFIFGARFDMDKNNHIPTN